MRFLIILFVCISSSSFGQDKSAHFTTEVADTVGFKGVFNISFVLKNSSGKDIKLPDLEEHFIVIGGPNVSSSSMFINGEMSQELSYSYYLKPKSVGTFVIEPASISVEGKLYKTDWKKVVVLEGYTPPKKIDSNDFFFKWGERKRIPPMKKSKPEIKPKEQKKSTKKGKTYRL